MGGGEVGRSGVEREIGEGRVQVRRDVMVVGRGERRRGSECKVR